MAKQPNASPVIIKRKKVIGAGGHHGGAWKVAYADFVTAMMAFFLLMWLLNATTEKQRKGIVGLLQSDDPDQPGLGRRRAALSVATACFPNNSQVPVRDGGGTTAASGATVRALIPHRKTAKLLPRPCGRSRRCFWTVAVKARRWSSFCAMSSRKVTDEGLVIELFDLEDAALFEPESTIPAPVLDEIADLLAEVLNLASNKVAVQGHVRSYPITLIRNPVWDLSAARADAMRRKLEEAGLPGTRMQRMAGFADRVPATDNPMATRNNRLEVILLRRDR
jgi:chemotaxis protein MotB